MSTSKGSILGWDDGPDDDEDSWVDEDFDIEEVLNETEKQKEEHTVKKVNDTKRKTHKETNLRKSLGRRVVENPKGHHDEHNKVKNSKDLPKEPRGMKEKREKLSYEEQLARDMARLMPVAGWKPEVEETEVKDEPQMEPIKEKKHFKERKHAGHKKSNSTSEPVHIHYGDSPKKKIVDLQSRWADAPDEDDIEVEKKHSNHHQTREYYRKQKINDRLDWDQGIQHRNDDFAIPETDVPKRNVHHNHEHFTYDNSKETDSNKSGKKPKEKSTKLESMWA